MTPAHPIEAGLPTLHAVLRAVAPASEELDGEGLRRFDEIVARALAPRPPRVVRQLGLFLRVLEALALVRHGRRFRALESERARRLLAALERSPLLLLRRGVWGTRTLAFMGYYAQDPVRSAVGYGAAPSGWERPGRQGKGPWPGRENAAGLEPDVASMLERADETRGRDPGDSE